MAFITIDIEPMRVPAIKSRYLLVEWYAKRFIDDGHQHESLNDYAEQAALDMRDPSIKREVKAAVRAIKRQA